MAKLKHTLQKTWQEGLGNDYEQKLDLYFIPEDENGKSTWRDGIYTKLAADVKDPEGLNKRTVAVKQTEWKPGDFHGADTLSDETDGSALFSDNYASGRSFGFPFEETAETYYTDKVNDNLPTGIDVADFRVVSATEAGE